MMCGHILAFGWGFDYACNYLFCPQVNDDGHGGWRGCFFDQKSESADFLHVV